VLTFTVFSLKARSDSNTTLDTARVFTALSLFTLLSEPISSLVMSLATFLGAVGSFSRIQQFLDSPEREDKRKLVEISEKSANAITVQDADFGWDKPLLHNVSISVPWNQLTMVIGPVGCGKSVLLNGLLGEIPATSGKVTLGSSSVAYCSQTPWHMNGTIKQAIIGSSDWDEKWYARVVMACALTRDFKELPMGEESSIGSNGVALSGGQAQRLVCLTSLTPTTPSSCFALTFIYRRWPVQSMREGELSFSTTPSVDLTPPPRTMSSINSAESTVSSGNSRQLFYWSRHRVSELRLRLTYFWRY
jgi:ABC-type multidrug transport system fused ATPase/permease subunit